MLQLARSDKVCRIGMHGTAYDVEIEAEPSKVIFKERLRETFEAGVAQSDCNEPYSPTEGYLSAWLQIIFFNLSLNAQPHAIMP